MSSTSAKRWFPFMAVLLLGSGPLLAAPGDADSSLTPTPLILKDGRIANVSVHVLPFQSADAALGARASYTLNRLTRQSATDCFLTAQVIGHVGANEVGEGDTLRAHRLARSRADAVQASLIAGGLPAKSIASVWDWQFLVREPRATLWVFRLTEGEDCEGTPLEGARPAVADARPSPDTDVVPASPPAHAAATSRRVTPVSDQAASRNGNGNGSDRVIPAASEVGSEPDAAAGRTRAEGEAVVAAVQSSGDAPLSGSTEITFATNSSYFPPDARDRLEDLVAGLAEGERYQIRLKAAVSDSDQVVGAKSAEEARRYNRWLAERRLARIRNWLMRHAAGRDLTIETSFEDNDNSRAVSVAVVATS